MAEDLRQNTFEVVSHTFWDPNNGRLAARGPVDFVLRVHAGSLTFYSWANKKYLQLKKARLEHLSKHFKEAFDAGAGALGRDLAEGQYVTELTLWGREGQVVKRINHHDSFQQTPSDDPWQRLLMELVCELKSDLADEDLVHFEFLLDRFSAPELPPPFETGGVYKCPDDIKHMRVPINEGLYVRIGQPPGPSPLYLLRPKDIQGLDILKKEGGRMQPVGHLPAVRATVQRWRDDTSPPPACEIQYITGETERAGCIVIEGLESPYDVFVQKYRGR